MKNLHGRFFKHGKTTEKIMKSGDYVYLKHEYMVYKENYKNQLSIDTSFYSNEIIPHRFRIGKYTYCTGDYSFFQIYISVNWWIPPSPSFSSNEIEVMDFSIVFGKVL